MVSQKTFAEVKSGDKVIFLAGDRPGDVLEIDKIDPRNDELLIFLKETPDLARGLCRLGWWTKPEETCAWPTGSPFGSNELRIEILTQEILKQCILDCISRFQGTRNTFYQWRIAYYEKMFEEIYREKPSPPVE